MRSTAVRAVAVLLLLLSLSAASASADGLVVRFLHLYPGAQGPLDVYWVTADNTAVHCPMYTNYTGACSVVLPITVGGTFTLNVNIASTGEQLFNASLVYDDQSAGYTYLFYVQAGQEISALAVLRVTDEQGFQVNNTAPFGVFANLYSVDINSVTDLATNRAISGVVPALSAATPAYPLTSVIGETVIAIEGAGSRGFTGITAGAGSLVIAAIFPNGGITVVLYDVTHLNTSLATPAKLPAKHSKNWPVAVIVIAAVLGISGAVALISCLVTWVQDWRYTASKEGYQPV